MLQGTASDVGKSVLCTALCRIFYEDGYRVAPFKSQNMALNSYVTADGGEIGRAQGVQAEACGIVATVDMNPILLKPKGNMVSEVIVRGKHVADVEAGAYGDMVHQLWPAVCQSFQRLAAEYDIVVIEGAGSPTEINLRHRDIANMRVAEMADAPVVLVGDIDRGGVFASFVGTLALLEEHERQRVKGFIINKFRGQRALLEPGLDWLENQTGVPVLGVIPYMDARIDAEDSLSLSSLRLKKADEDLDMLNIHVIAWPWMSNFTDLEPLLDEPRVHIRLVSRASDWGDPDVIMLPGTENPVQSLRWLRDSGLAERIVAAVAAGAHMAGIGSGYPIMGETLWEPGGEGANHRQQHGLGLLPVTTHLTADEPAAQVDGHVIDVPFAAGACISGYVLRRGRTERTGGRPFIRLADGRTDGTVVLNGRVWGTDWHGLFHNRVFTRAWLNHVRQVKGMAPVDGLVVSEAARREASYRALADVVRKHLDMEKLAQVMGL